MMRKSSQLCTPFAFAGLLFLGATPAALGCGFHNLEMQLESMYPGSLTVAMALHKAGDNGVINATALEAPSNGTTRYADSVDRLQAFRKALADSPAAAKLPASFSLGYVESHLWSRYSQSNGEVHVDIYTDGPVKEEAVVLTGEPVLTEVLAGRLSVDRALSDGLIIIEGNEKGQAAIRQALKAMSMSDRISSL